MNTHNALSRNNTNDGQVNNRPVPIASQMVMVEDVGQGPLIDASTSLTTLVSAEETNQNCSICFTNYAPEIEGTLVPCSHKFCFSCIHQWSRLSNSCPLCRASFQVIVRSDSTTHDASAPPEPPVLKRSSGSSSSLDSSSSSFSSSSSSPGLHAGRRPVPPVPERAALIRQHLRLLSHCTQCPGCEMENCAQMKVSAPSHHAIPPPFALLLAFPFPTAPHFLFAPVQPPVVLCCIQLPL
mmetsp:Transcript_11399/g.20342  ORF Transcript_11399/g.20342 Transcript_11399/m.20342 type:complete len:239 (+) Transcript_11399:399-1115(+)